jgi:hypothetical protein
MLIMNIKKADIAAGLDRFIGGFTGSTQVSAMQRQT